jgi:hypothetical protein
MPNITRLWLYNTETKQITHSVNVKPPQTHTDQRPDGTLKQKWKYPITSWTRLPEPLSSQHPQLTQEQPQGPVPFPSQSLPSAAPSECQAGKVSTPKMTPGPSSPQPWPMQEVAAEEEEQDEWFDAQEHFETPLPCRRLCDQACLLTRGTPESAGLDLYAATEQVIQPGAQAQIKTGLALALPKGTYGRIAP